MTKFRVILLLILGLTMVSFAQSEEVKPTLSKNPLTAEQIAVYRAFLQFYEHGTDKELNVANTTDWLDVSELRQDSDCSESFGRVEYENAQPGGPSVHTLTPNLAVAGRIVLVDPARQTEKVKQNDPSKTVHEGRSVDHAVSTAFASGLLTLSEIVFDKDHHRAVMSFSFFCGKLCGNGGIVMFKRVGQKWKITKQSCREWIS